MVDLQAINGIVKSFTRGLRGVACNRLYLRIAGETLFHDAFRPIQQGVIVGPERVAGEVLWLFMPNTTIDNTIGKGEVGPDRQLGKLVLQATTVTIADQYPHPHSFSTGEN